MDRLTVTTNDRNHKYISLPELAEIFPRLNAKSVSKKPPIIK